MRGVISRWEGRLRRLSRAQFSALVILLLLTAIVPGAISAVWMDWHQRGSYEPLGYYAANSWNSWRASIPADTRSSESPSAPPSVARLSAKPVVATAAKADVLTKY